MLKHQNIDASSQEIGVFSATTYSWDLHKTHTVWNTLNLTSGEISLLYNGSEISEIVWVGPNDTSILYINGTNEEDNGGISIYGADITAIDQAWVQSAHDMRTQLTPADTSSPLYRHHTLV